MLDIFGFESFKQNGFEQFCINSAAEKLQHRYLTAVLVDAEQAYVEEGLLRACIRRESCVLVFGLWTMRSIHRSKSDFDKKLCSCLAL